MRSAARRAGCSEGEVRGAAAALARDELPDAWGYTFERGQAVAPNGDRGDPRDDFQDYLGAWLANGGVQGHRARGGAL